MATDKGNVHGNRQKKMEGNAPGRGWAPEFCLGVGKYFRAPGGKTLWPIVYGFLGSLAAVGGNFKIDL
jgi:hypothetical protein